MGQELEFRCEGAGRFTSTGIGDLLFFFLALLDFIPRDVYILYGSENCPLYMGKSDFSGSLLLSWQDY